MILSFQKNYAIIKLLQENGSAVSIFIAPDMKQIKAAHKLGVDYIEIHTGAYAKARSIKEEDQEFEKILNVVKLGSKLGLGINAGHDLTYRNVSRIASIKEIEELTIGHNLIVRALFVGMDQAVKEMRQLIEKATKKKFLILSSEILFTCFLIFDKASITF